MLRVRTYVAPSRIAGAGLGLFAKDHIAAGKLVWRFDPEFDVEIASMPDDPVIMSFLQTYAYMPRDGAERWISCGDNTRFLNHSDEPGLVGDEWISHAARDLVAGEELTIDYRSFDRRPIEFWI